MAQQSLLERAQRAARSGNIDTEAPVTASAQCVIRTSADSAWEVLATIEQWPSFIPGVSQAQLLEPKAEFGVGSQFAWKNAGIRIRSTVEVAERSKSLTWTGKALWLIAVHRNAFESTGENECVLTSSESMAGFGTSLLMPQQQLERQLATFVHAVKQEAERRTQPSSPSQ